jgi:PKD repeat protein
LVKRIFAILLFSFVVIWISSCGGGGGGIDNPISPYGPPPSIDTPDDTGETPLPFPVFDDPLPDPITAAYFDTSTDSDGRAMMPGFAQANKRSQASLPMRVGVVGQERAALKDIIVRRVRIGDEYVLFIWDPSGFYNPRFIDSRSLTRAIQANVPDRKGMLTESLGVLNPATINIGIGAESIDIAIGLEKISNLNENAISDYKSYFTDQYMFSTLDTMLEANVFSNKSVKNYGTYAIWTLPEAISTMTKDGALIFVAGYVDLINDKLSTFQMGSLDDDIDDSELTNSFINPRIPTNSTGCMTLFSGILQVAKNQDAGAVRSSFENAFLNHPIYQNLGDEQRYLIINFKPLLDMKTSAISAPTTRVKDIIIVVPLDPRTLGIEPSDGSYKFSSGITKIFKVTGNYIDGAAYTLSPFPVAENWYRNTIVTNVDPILPGDVISQPGQNRLPSATFLVELDRFISVTQLMHDYTDDEALRLNSPLISLQPYGGSVTNLPPDLNIVFANPTQGRAPLSVTFDATGATDEDGAVISYEWNFGDPAYPEGGFDEGAVVQHLYAQPGVRTALLTVKDDGIPQNTVMKQFTITLTANQPPVAVIADIEVTEGRAPFTVQFDGSPSYDPDGSIVEWRWDFGDGPPVYQVQPEHTFTTEGQYVVTLRVTDDGPSNPPRWAEDTVTINVLPESTNRAPVAMFTADPESGLAPLSVQFDSSQSSDPDSDQVTYQWYFGDTDIVGGGQSTQPNPLHTYNTPQTATVTLEVTDIPQEIGADPLTSFYQVQIEVTEITNLDPIAVIAMDVDNGQPPLVVTFDGTGSHDDDGNIVGYSWDFGDLQTAFGHTVQHTYNTVGVFEVKLTVSDDGDPPATGEITAEVVVGNTRPVADISADPIDGFAPQIVHFDASGSSDIDGNTLSYLWDFDDAGATSTEAVLDYEFVNVGTYHVTLTVTDDSPLRNLSSTDTVTITIAERPPNNPPIVNFTATPRFGSSPLEVVFNSSDNSYDPDGDEIVTYSWDFGDSSGTSSQPNPTYTYTSAGAYHVILQLTDNGIPPATGASDTFIYVDVNAVPVAVPEADVVEGVEPLTVQFTGDNSYDLDGTITSYYWDFRTGDTSTEPNPEYTFTTFGEYIVRLTVEDNNSPPASNTKTILIDVRSSTNQPPVAIISANPTQGNHPLTVNFSSLLSTDDGEIANVHWNFGDPLGGPLNQSTLEEPTYQYFLRGNYTVTLIVYDNGDPQLSDEDTVIIQVR